MLLNGQIACFVPSPLIGPNIDELGTRFPDMSQIYDLEFQKIARKAAASLDIDLMEGVYLQLTGPQYESPQEIAMCRTLGADAVGMSTACEAIVAGPDLQEAIDLAVKRIADSWATEKVSR